MLGNKSHATRGNDAAGRSPRIPQPSEPRAAGETDILTRLHGAEEALQASEARLRAVLDNLPDAYFQADLSGRFTFVNSPALQMYGFDSAAQMIGLPAEALYADPKDGGLLHAVRRGRSVNDQVVLCRKRNGTKFWVSMSVHISRDNTGQIVGTEGVVRDITEHKEAQEESRLLKAALEATANAVVITDRDGRIEWTNPAFTALTGYTAEEVIGQTPRILRSGDHPAEFYTRMWETILSANVWRGEVTNRRKDGTVYIEEMTITPIRSSNGKYLHFVAVKQDVTDRKCLEDQLRQAQKMEAIGTLAGGIAHDFNNLLNVIGGYNEVLEDHIGDDTTLVDTVGEIRTAVKSAADLTRQLLAFSRKQVLQPQVVSLNGVVSNTVSMLRRVLGDDIVLDVQLDPTLGNVIADPGQLQQVIMNLAVNARDAMPNGGILTIETENVDLETAGIEEKKLLQPGRYVRVALRDTGMGMDEITLQRAFEPFFTTKPLGQGSGLGLATVYGIVKQSGGYVFLSGSLGQGSLAEVYFARTEERAHESVKGLSIQAKTGNETIFVVEDYASLRKMICKGLERNGYTVITAQHGQEALEVAGSYEREIDLLVADVIMPGMDGPQLAKRLIKQRPQMRTLYMSGDTHEMLGRRRIIGPDVMFIKKPFELTDLLAKVREALEASAAESERSDPPAA